MNGMGREALFMQNYYMARNEKLSAAFTGTATSDPLTVKVVINYTTIT